MRRTMTFDIMRPVGRDERFVCTLRYEWSPIFKFDFNDFYKFICEKRPSLKGKPFTVYTDDKIVPRIYFNQEHDKIAERWAY